MATSIDSSSGSIDTVTKNQLEVLIAEVGTLAERLNESKVQSFDWYQTSVELQKACLRMRSLHARLAERSQRLSELSSIRKVKVSHELFDGGRVGMGRGADRRR